MKVNPHVPYLAAVSGAILFFVTFHISWFAIPEYVHRLIAQEAFITKGSHSFNMWSTKSHNFKFKIYVFNITNPSEVKDGRKPVLKEIGPYVYDLVRDHIKVEEKPLTDSVIYYERKTYYFNKTESGNLEEADIFTIFNTELLSSAMELYLIFPDLLSILTQVFPYLFPGMKDAFLQKSVREVFFDGIVINCESEVADSVCRHIEPDSLGNLRHAPNNSKNFVVSLFVNESEAGPFEMYRGVNNLLNRGQLKTINHKNTLDIWKGECDVVKGSDGFFFSPLTNIQDHVDIYIPEICRPLHFVQENKISDTIQQFLLNNKSFSFDNTDCYCADESVNNNSLKAACPPYGIMEIRQCIRTSMWLSLPHFYLADKNLLNPVEGLKPESNLHSSFINIETVSGVTMNATVRIQFNQRVKQIKDFFYLENVSDCVIPLGWIETSYHLLDDFKDSIDKHVHRLNLITIAKWSLLIVGSVLTSAAIVFCIYFELCSENVKNKFPLCAKFKSRKADQQLELYNTVL
ncbi:sensory neuron membrane protein 1-like [Agrilus planipennis]|uniref:Sensory neuron membrane protein 1-like n=1 Tax=Agrilus planipennis TaxID=224129 RepID=A0A1W4XH30_AGRPL|nr:sensory neuron membrane protein 1-like [Agrilus planipennis]